MRCVGTRNAIAVVSDKKLRVGQYCQWDGYPTGQGADICEFIQTQMDLPKFKQALAECKFLSLKELQEKWKELGADDSGFVNMSISDQMLKTYPAFHRDTGAKILKLIQDGKVRELDDAVSRMDLEDNWIEWSYLLDLDTETLHVYKGMLDIKHPEKGVLNSYPFKKATVKAMKKLEEEEEDE